MEQFEVRCSALARFMTCIGHLKLKEREPQEEGDAAREGTAVGEYLTAMIKQRTETPAFGVTASNGYFVNDEMKYYALETYRNVLATAQGNLIESEERIDWTVDAGKIRGQFDISYVVGGRQEGEHRVGCTLHVEDLKYGWKLVEVEENWQLLGYAIGQHKRLLQKGIYIDNVVLRIHQPRPFHPDGKIRTWTITINELLNYYHKIVAQLREFHTNNKSLITGNACAYCDAASACPALNKAFHNAVDVVLRDYTEKELTNQDLSELIGIIERAEDVIEIKSKSIKQLAVSRLQNNQMIPGYAMMQKFGDRKWKEGVTAEAVKMMTGIDLMKTEMMSPNQAEKAGVNKKLTEQLTMKPSKGFEITRVNTTEQANKLFNK